MFHKKIVWHNIMGKCYEEEVPNRIVGWKIIQYSEMWRSIMLYQNKETVMIVVYLLLCTSFT